MAKPTQDADREIPPELPRWGEEERRERRQLVWALAAAVALHAAVLFARAPSWGPDPMRVDAPRQVEMKVQFLAPPPPPKAPPKPPEPERKKVPRPDPTPDEPEPAPDLEPEAAPHEPFAEPSTGEPAEETGPIRVMPGQGPGIVKKVEPEYPPVAEAARLEGTVTLDAVIRKDGSVSDVTVLKSSNRLFNDNAVEAIQQWRFTPGSRDVILSVTIKFVLDRGR